MGENIQVGKSRFGKMVSYPPLAPSADWFTAFLKALSNGKSEEEAIVTANLKLNSFKELGRYVINDTNGDKIILSLAVEGGGKQLKKSDGLESLRLSEHGNWRKVHMGGLEAALGRTPFYRDIEPGIKSVYQNLDIKSLEEFNIAIFQVLKSFLLGSNTPERLFECRKCIAWQDRGKELAENISMELSMIQSLSEYGREALLGIMMMDCL